MKFSERYGYKKVRGVVQIDSMDDPLRNALWNVLKVNVWDDIRASTGLYHHYSLASRGNEPIRALCERLWSSYFKKPLDELDSEWDKTYQELRDYFFRCKWFEVYDFIEFVLSNYSKPQLRDKFITRCNTVLEKEVSAYRFVGDTITRITEQREIDEIEQALQTARGPVQAHLQRSLELLSNRERPDYRNSVKESISAVESLVARVLGEKGTLGQLIKKLEDEIELHPALRSAFSSLYGYTSDAGGVRHALMEAENVGFDEAKFLLVVCSAFINFVDAKING